MSLDTFIGNVDRMIINPLIYFLFALAIAYFLFGMVEFLMNLSNQEKKTTGKSHMLWGIVGITIMIGVWAILNLIMSTFGITGIDPQNSSVNIPFSP